MWAFGMLKWSSRAIPVAKYTFSGWRDFWWKRLPTWYQKRHQNQAWSARGYHFWDFGCFFEAPIFGEFSIGKKASENQQKTFQKRKLRFSCACHQFGFHFLYIFNQFWWDFHTFTTHPPLPCNKMMPATHPGPQRTRHRFVLVFRWCPKPFLETKKTLEHFPHEPANNR